MGSNLSKKSHGVHVTLTEEMYQACKAQAEKEALNDVASYIRRRIIGYGAPPPGFSVKDA